MPSLLQTLQQQPGRFSFDAAITVLLAASGAAPEQALRFETVAGLAPALRDVLSVREDWRGDHRRYTVRIGFSGLTGPGGVLPRPYTEMAGEERRRRSQAMGGFFDMLSQRFLLQYALAGAKYHPARAALISGPMPKAATRAVAVPERDGIAQALLSLTGHGLPGDLERSALGVNQLLYFSGLFASRPRSADRLGALLGEWLDVPVRIEQFVGSWQVLDPSERTRLGARYSTLGSDTAAGGRVWDIQGRIQITVGPLDLGRFEALLPGSPRLELLQRLIRTFLDDEAAFAVKLILRGDAVPPARMGGVRLGHTGWLPTTRLPRPDAEDTVFADNAARRA